MKQIPLTQGQFAIVDNRNYVWLSQWKWYACWNKDTQSFYAIRHGKKENDKQCTIYMHREILGLEHGNERQADHRNHDTLDDRESNLRIVTHGQNQWNRRNTKGYYWDKRVKKYHTQIRVNGKTIYLGDFDTTREAHNVYLRAKEKYHKF